jgi:hypothetical protein
MSTDRDRSLDRMLRRGAAHPRRAAHDDCPDGETLAAFADRGLDAGGSRAVEQHIAGCDRCQAITAAMVRADAAGSAAVEPLLSWWPPNRIVRWLAPAAAAAFAVTLWILVPGQRTPLVERPSEQAAVEQPPAALAPPPAAMPAAPPPEQANQSVEKLAKQADERETAPARVQEEQRARTAAESAQTSVDNLGRTDAPRNERAAAAPAPSAAAAPPTAADTTTMRAAAAFAGVATAAIVSPDPQVRWRIRPGAIVERSSDGGSTWTAQQTPSATELTAGSAPAPTVCWIVGRTGTVVRTVDGGATWQRVPFPESIDLTAVNASTPLAATVTLADGRRFGTADGGQTWREIP